MNGDPNSRMGFTIVELLVVAVLGVLLLTAAYQVLNSNQRTYAVQSEKVRGQQSLRAAMDVLTSELRELSPAAGDIVDFTSDDIELQLSRTFGLVCQVDNGGEGVLGFFGSDPELMVLRYGAWFTEGDSVVIFADNNPDIANDDVWIPAQVTDVDTGASCNGSPAQVLAFAGQATTFAADAVRPGAPMRALVPARFRRTEEGNLWRSIPSGSGDLVGPVDLELSYFDALGDPTTVAANVAQIEVKLKTSSGIRTSGGSQVRDSLVARVYPRN